MGQFTYSMAIFGPPTGPPGFGGGHSIVTPETLLAWNWKLIAHKYDGSGQRRPGQELLHLAVRHARAQGDHRAAGRGDRGDGPG